MIRAVSLATIGVAAALALGAAVPVTKVDEATINRPTFPAHLSDYRFFEDAGARVPNKNVIPYRLNTPLFSDYAEKLRYLYIPDGMQAKANGEELIALPVGSAIIKSFGYEQAGKLRLIETRVMLHRADGWIALPYVWNAAQDEALLKLGGSRVPVTFADPRGKMRSISYAVPNKNQCKECHAVNGAVTPIGPKARNMDAAFLAQLVAMGKLDAVPAVARRLPVWEDRADATVEAAARAYLDVNCAHCHRPEGSASNSGLNLGWEVTDRVALGIGKRPVAAGRGSGGFDFDIAPGDPAHSIMTHRMKSLESGIAMPELGRATVHDEGVAAVEAWISRLR
mgnify:CR=1 FL=1